MNTFQINKCMQLIFLIISINSFISTCNAAASFSGSFYNSENGLYISEDNDNSNSIGSISLLPFDGYGESPYSIKSFSQGNSNGGSGNVAHSSSIIASGNENTVDCGFFFSEDSALRGTSFTSWNQEVLLGEGNNLHLSATITSKPGYLTYPTSPDRDSITAGMTLECINSTGHPAFETKQVPPSDFEDFPLVLGVMKSPKYSDVYMQNKLNLELTW